MQIVGVNIKTGLDMIEEENFISIRGAKTGLLINPASVNRRLEHAADIFIRGSGMNARNNGGEELFQLKAFFGPQHGIYGNTQDNMIEWEGFRDPRTKLPIYSLYGKNRKPTQEMLDGIEVLVADLPDVGSRYYTFVWTAKLCMEACAENGIRMLVLDRPNPITGEMVEGPILDPEFRSFVGLYPIPIRHGLTMGEILWMINREENIGCNLEIIKIHGWWRDMWFDDTHLPWVLPSPNMPTLKTAMVYPGGCLLEATNISEGRGTCRPFELVGAPYINPEKTVKELNGLKLPGVYFRPLCFQPTFNKYQGELCGGFQVHVKERKVFKPVKTYVEIINIIHKLHPDEFQWKTPPYEYEHEKLPIDILWGDSSLRETIDRNGDLEEIFYRMEVESFRFEGHREEYLMY